MRTITGLYCGTAPRAESTSSDAISLELAVLRCQAAKAALFAPPLSPAILSTKSYLMLNGGSLRFAGSAFEQIAQTCRLEGEASHIIGIKVWRYARRL